MSKGDKDRTTKKSQFDSNYDSIDWTKKTNAEQYADAKVEEARKTLREIGIIDEDNKLKEEYGGKCKCGEVGEHECTRACIIGFMN